MVLNHEERYELSVQLIDTVHFMITSQDHHKIVRGLEILEGLAEKDSNVPFLVDLPVNTLQVIFNALLLGDLQVSEGVVQCTDCRHSLAAKCYASVVYCFLPPLPPVLVAMAPAAPLCQPGLPHWSDRPQ